MMKSRAGNPAGGDEAVAVEGSPANEQVAARLHAARSIAQAAMWTAIGTALAGLERLIPTPVPWIKIGLANGAALVVLYRMGWKWALSVNLLRIFLAGLLLGSWSSPAFLLSLGGGISAVLAMAAVRSLGRRWIGPIGVSTAGAWTHMLVQFVIASVVIVRHGGLLLIAGPSLVAAVISGVLVGWIGGEIIRRIN